MSLNKFTIQKSFAISAGAGSGKTYTLSRRYINALLGFDYFREDYKSHDSYIESLKAATVNQIVTLTYTEAAALEMKGRIFELISKILDKSEDKTDGDFRSIIEANNELNKKEKEYVLNTLEKAFEDSSNAKISTIHSFCLNVIKSNCDLARIDNKLDMIKDDEKESLLSNIIFDVLNDTRNENLIYELSSDINMYFINNLINKYVSNSKFRDDYDSFSKTSISLRDYKMLMFELYDLPELAEDLFAFEAYVLENKLEDGQKYIDFVKEYIERVFNFQAKSWSALSKDLNLIIAFNRKPWTQHKSIKVHIDSIKRLDSYVEVFSEINEENENLFYERIENIKTLLVQIKKKYDDELKALNKIDFDTIISKTNEIMPLISSSFKYIMVDEFQDTNSLQFDIIKNAKNSDCNLFVVGDSKQSIYSFQGAEIEVFNTAVKNRDIFSSIEDMSKNHRSDGLVLKNVNKIFKKILQKNDKFDLMSSDYEAQAQDLSVFNSNKKNKGSFKYLITSAVYKEESNELDTIASFVSDIYNKRNSDYSHISDLIEKKEKAIAIIFDSKSKMLELKSKLNNKGIFVKVSASDNFYYTKEINDIFNVLKAINILSEKKEDFNSSQKYYLSAAMRSNILRCDDNSINAYLESNTVCDKLEEYVEVFNNNTLAFSIKYICDDSNVLGVYSHFEDSNQRYANLNKFFLLALDYENSNENSLYKFLDLIQNAIYFSQAKEDEAFFKSDNAKSIEICSIHSTKGLSYPLVLLANSTKALYSQIQSDALKHNNFTLNNQRKELVGFKINNYTPLSYRVLKEIDKLKHLAEKKRLLYVALTRAEHDVVISAHLKQSKNKSISLKEDSYLHMIINSLDININELFAQNETYCISIKDKDSDISIISSVEYIDYKLKKLDFKKEEYISATQNSKTINEEAASLGTLTHKIIELYWNKFKDNKKDIFFKEGIFDEDVQTKISKSMDIFYQSEVYKQLKNNVEHRFELEFNLENKKGFIDFIYYDKKEDGWIIIDFKTGIENKEKNIKYQEQLKFYENVLFDLNMKVIKSELLWL